MSLDFACTCLLRHALALGDRSVALTVIVIATRRSEHNSAAQVVLFIWTFVRNFKWKEMRISLMYMLLSSATKTNNQVGGSAVLATLYIRMTCALLYLPGQFFLTVTFRDSYFGPLPF